MTFRSNHHQAGLSFSLMGWVYGGASVVGTSHAATDEPCQDNHAAYHTVSQNGSEVLLLVCADGAGSARRAAEGSLTACTSIVECLETYLASNAELTEIDEGNVLSWLGVAHAALEAVAADAGLAVRDYACTIVVALVFTSRSIFAHIGDGGVVINGEGDQLLEVGSWPTQGLYANSTYFLSDADWPDHVRLLNWPRSVNRIAVFTDGIQRLALDFASNLPHEPFFLPLFEHLETSGVAADASSLLKQMLSSAAFDARTDDDKTLLLGIRTQD